MRKIVLFLFFFIALSSNELAAQETSKKVMIVYGSDECHHCTDTKAYLKKNNIDFIFFDIDKNAAALNEMLAKLRKAGISTSNLGIPVIDKQGEIFTNNGVFEEFLKKLN
ncbi:glutaredoxin family protein [Flavobacterium sp.]|uniref:glutaredoxin family protein n=1 Tax=Flavobacterium sp. TaxID=239 RepID=UPI0026022FB2|nr:glutaredoxin family protein [Flavobacterium sp.]